MYIKKIEWLDKEGKEAIVEVAKGMESMICFSCPCLYNPGDVLLEPLECLDASNVVLCNTKEYDVKKMEGAFKYKLKGQVKNKKKGIIDVLGFDIHIDEEQIPVDIKDEMYIEFVTSRVDVW